MTYGQFVLDLIAKYPGLADMPIKDLATVAQPLYQIAFAPQHALNASSVGVGQ